MSDSSSVIESLEQRSASVDLIQRHAGGGLRRIAEAAGVTIVDGRGSRLIDDRGRSYLDFVTGYGVAALGHRNPRWVCAVSEQARRLCTSPFHTPQLAEYLSKLAEALPFEGARPALFSGGAEAVEVALRLGQLASRRPGVLAFRTAFHGKTAGVRFAGGAYETERSWLGPTWIRHAEFPVRAPDDENIASVSEQLSCRDDLADVGTVIVEPVLGTAGNVPPRRGFLSELREVCSARGWLLVFDESLTGFGRTGARFAADFFGVVPDILVMGKAMGGGFPLSGVAASSELWAAASLDRPSATSTSYGANPLACAAGLAVLDTLAEPGFLEQVRRTGRVLSEGLHALAEESAYVSGPRGMGLMLGFDIIDPNTGRLAGSEVCSRVFERCRARGLLIAADVARVRLCPPLTLSTVEAEEALAILSEALT